jgi:cyclopropane-fatty-acyl-phospholipid synthase
VRELPSDDGETARGANLQSSTHERDTLRFRSRTSAGVARTRGGADGAARRTSAAVERPSVTAYRALVERLFAKANVRVDGDRPFDVRVTDDRFYRRVLTDGSLGLGEAYVDGWWECDRVDEAMCRFARANLYRLSVTDVRLLANIALVKLRGLGAKSKAFEVGRRHYDLGNALFERMLDPRMIYSCAYWATATTLAEAQEHKLDLVCRKLALAPGMRVLDIGSGWGGFAKFAAERYGVRVVGVTVSEEQLSHARIACAGLPVDFRLLDYRDIDERFDRVVSIGMFEHVGHRHHGTFMKVVDRCLADDGVALVHSIVGNEALGPAEIPWITTYIFPNGEIPSLGQLTAAAEKTLVVEALHRFDDDDYDKTLACWYENFIAQRPAIGPSYDERFFRLWSFYLLMARGLFQARTLHVWQAILAKRNRRAPALATYEAR